jgi:NAD(P)H-dependent FMN reductase
MKLLVFAASHRKQSINRKLAAIAAGIAQEQGHAIDFPEYGEFDMPIYDDETARRTELPEAASRFVARLSKAQAIILSSPEYNWSFPGSLKNIIDWASVASPNPFAGKAALLLSASPSLRGGAQGLVQLKLPLESLGMFVFPRIFTLGRAQEALSAKGRLKDAKLQEELERLVKHFLVGAKALSGYSRAVRE